MTDEFHQADLDDYLIDRAWEHDLRQADWDDLHGAWVDRPTLDQAFKEMGRDRREAAREIPNDR